MNLKHASILVALLFLAACTPMNAEQADEDLITGYEYLKGSGDKTQNSAKAMEYFTKAAKQGNRDAQYNVGLAYVRAEGVAKDFAKAYTWFEKAAYQDDVGAQYNLGVMSVNGEGVVADPLIAYVWFKLADEKGYDGAKEGMETARKNMTEDQAKEIDAVYAKISSKIKKPVEPVSADDVPL